MWRIEVCAETPVFRWMISSNEFIDAILRRHARHVGLINALVPDDSCHLDVWDRIGFYIKIPVVCRTISFLEFIDAAHDGRWSHGSARPSCQLDQYSNRRWFLPSPWVRSVDTSPVGVRVHPPRRLVPAWEMVHLWCYHHHPFRQGLTSGLVFKMILAISLCEVGG